MKSVDITGFFDTGSSFQYDGYFHAYMMGKSIILETAGNQKNSLISAVLVG